MKTFALLCPTRQRPDFVKDYLDSIENTVKYPERITVMIGYDDDDTLTEELMSNIKTYPFKIRWCKRERSIFINKDYYNWLAEQVATEDSNYIFVNADDVRHIVKDWDVTIESKIEMYCNDKPDRLIGIGVKDNTPKPKASLPEFPCFPLVTRESFNHFKFVLHPYIPTWGADYTFYRLYFDSGRYLAIDDKIYMHHIGVHTKTAPKDATALQVEKTFNALKGNPKYSTDYHLANSIPNEVTTFKNHLRGINK